MAGTYQTALGLVSDPFGLNSGMVCTGHHQLKKKKEQAQKDSKKLNSYEIYLSTPQSDLHLISPYNITPKSHIKVMRIKDMITN